MKKKFRKKTKIDDWYPEKRNILHFDYPISFENAQSKVTDKIFVKRYSFFPLLTFNINSLKYKKDSITNQMKKTPKTRTICYSAHLDNCIHSYYAKELSQKYEQLIKELKIDKSILAFRKLEKSNIDFAKLAFENIREYGKSSVIAIDFSNFFNTLNHKILKEQWSKVLSEKELPLDHYNIYKSITRYTTVDKHEIFKLFNISKNNLKNRPRRICSIKDFRNKVRKNNYIIPSETIQDKEGIPQGTSISALLSNIYMIDFDKAILDYVNSFGGKYYRYCDDILIIDPTFKSKKRKEFIYNLIDDNSLTINKSKTETRIFKYKNKILCANKPLQYLGFLFNGHNIYLRSSSITKYYQRMKKGVKLAKKSKLKYNLIRRKKGLKEEPLFKKKLYEKYSHLGVQNFVKYGFNAQKEMESNTIRKQLKKLWLKLNEEIKKEL